MKAGLIAFTPFASGVYCEETAVSLDERGKEKTGLI